MMRVALFLLLTACTKGRAADSAQTSTEGHVRSGTVSHAPSDSFGTKRIFIDPGHGTGRNSGTLTVFCEEEQTITLQLSKKLSEDLSATGHFQVRLSREDNEGPSYRSRIRAAERFRADALLSIHIDARGAVTEWYPKTSSGTKPRACPRNDGHRGFAILWSDRGKRALVDQRKRLARTIAQRLALSGFLPYDGADFKRLYQKDVTPGVFIDRRGLVMLRDPSVPSVIIETHHSINLIERKQWLSQKTEDVFSKAIIHALNDYNRSR